jgi:predicted  nucleic acid-binding Zn-ribbon protein
MDELSHSILLLSQEIHELHKQLASDSQDYQSSLEDDAIYANLLHQSSRIVRRLNRLDSATPKPTT